jgi:thiamine kinase-like enzyme
VRSDNLCFAGDRVVLVDWNWACRGNRTVDVASWLPSLHLEGGPPPEAILPRAPTLAAAISGYFAARAGRHAETESDRAVRVLQLSQLRVALPWAVRALGLAALGR